MNLIERAEAVIQDAKAVSSAHNPKNQDHNYNRCELCDHTRSPCETKALADDAVDIITDLLAIVKRLPVTADGVAAAWPVGWTITIRIRHDGKCFAGAANAAGEAVGPNGWYDTEWEARANLHIAVREAEANQCQA